ncbi:MAG TPA: PaaI family thioesterase [Caulobacterales bacterium]|nr:PaaI family thioesterase [Caulobacterales bacterium]
MTDPHLPSDEAMQRVKAMMQFTPQAQALGLEITRIADGRVWGHAPYRAELVGDPDTGVIAGGVVTTFLDQLCGVAAVVAQTHPTPVATIDLRIDYMRPAEPGRDVLAEAQCFKLTRHVAFVRAVAYDAHANDPVAHATATFALGANGKRAQ